MKQCQETARFAVMCNSDVNIQLHPTCARAFSAFDATLDYDNDGLNNLEEYQRSTNPYSPGSDGDLWSAPIDLRPKSPLIPNGVVFVIVAIIISIIIIIALLWPQKRRKLRR